jgi:hypothetical protein
MGMMAEMARPAAAAISPYSKAVAPESSIMKCTMVLMQSFRVPCSRLRRRAHPDLFLSTYVPTMLASRALRSGNQAHAAEAHIGLLVNPDCLESERLTGLSTVPVQAPGRPRNDNKSSFTNFG